jgi:ParB/RepB/Spo0J family partition protein
MLLKLEDIHQSPISLRPVNRDTYDYEFLALSVKDRGVLMPILVRPSQRGYEIIKGQRRYEAARDAGHKEIPAQIISATDSEVMEIQAITSSHFYEVKPMEYANVILKLCAYSPTITLIEMAKKLCKSPKWVREILGLPRRLHKDSKFLVDLGRINLSNGYVLSRLPEEEQLKYLDKAQAMDCSEFTSIVQARVKEIRDEKRGRYSGQANAQRVCVAHVSREFFQDGKSDGTETEFIYEGDAIAESLKGCTTMDEVRVVVQEPPKVDYYWVVTQVQLKDRVIV